MVLPLARSRDEALLYLDLQPCGECGAADAAWRNALTRDGAALARRYWADCGRCGAGREYVFRLPARPLPPSSGLAVRFGGDQQSELLDAGEWLWLADRCAQATVPDDEADLDPESRDSLAVALAAMDEVLKFVPAGADSPPAGAFWSERGRQLRDRQPARFRRARLEIVRDTYREHLAPFLG